MVTKAQLEAVVADQRQSLHEISEQLNEANATIRRHHTTIGELRKAVAQLKDVARFFRAQRDKVDGYLSGVLDTVQGNLGAQPGNIESLRHRQRNLVDELQSIDHSLQSTQGNNRPSVDEPRADGFDEYQMHVGRTRGEAPPRWEDL